MTTKNAKIPHFFKIILSDFISEAKLIIPRMFVKRFGSHLFDKVFLKVPNGSKWQVELVKNGDHIYFGNGWQQFAEHHSLAHGSFLVFGLENFRTCCLSVMIFDKTASEIDYPNNTDQSDVSNRPCKKMKQYNCSVQSQADRQNPDRSNKRKQPLTVEQNAGVVKRRITCFKSNNPSFSITIHPSHVSQRYIVTIPVTSTIQYFTKQRGNIILNSVKGQTWCVEYVNYRTNWGSNLTTLSRGWRKFACDNQLAVGDVCVFELIKGNPDELKVVIRRNFRDAKKTIISTGNNKRSNIIKNMGDSITVNPYFKVNLTQNHLHKHSINLPAKFMEKYNNPIAEKAMLKVENRVWPVKLLSYPSYRIFQLSVGFSTFLKDNSLQVGDTCVFELINSIPFYLKVSIVRHTD